MAGNKQTRIVDVRVTSNVGKTMKKGTAEAKGLGGALKGVAASASLATGGIRTMTMALISSGVGAFVVAIGGIISGITGLVNKSKEFEQAFANLAAVTGQSREELEALKQNAIELGSTTAFTATQVLELSQEFAKLGFTQNEILNASEATLDLAAAAGVDLAEAATVAGATLRGFGLDTTETGRVVDVMAKSFTSSALDMDKFKESMKLVAPIAKTTKVTIEESAAALSVLADRGVSGSMAGTQLRRVMSDLAQKTGKDFQTSLEITADRLDKAASTADKLAIAKELVGDRAKGSLIALAENRSEVTRLAEAYQNAGGAAEAMAEEKLNTLEGSFIKLSSAWDGFLLGLEDGSGVLSKLAKGSVDFLTRAIGRLGDYSKAVGLQAEAFGIYWDSLGVRFTNIGLNIEEFALKARLALEKVPFWGNAEDTARLENQLAAVRGAQAQALADIEEFNEAYLDKEAEAFVAYMGINRQKADDDRALSVVKGQIQDEFIEGSNEKDDADRKQKEEAARLFAEKIRKQKEDAEDQDDISKLERKKKRQLAELEALTMDENEKGQLREDIELYWENEIVTKKAEIQRAAQEKKDEQDKLAREKKKEQDEQDEQNEKDLQAAKLRMAINGLSAIDAITQAFAGKSEKQQRKAFNISKKLRLAQTTLSGIEGTQNAYTTAQESPITALFPAYPYIQAGIAAAFSVAQIASIANTTFQGGGRGAAAGTSAGGRQAAQPQAPAFNVIGQTSAGDNMIADTIGQANSQPTRAYVVESDISNSQELARKADNLASIG